MTRGLRNNNPLNIRRVVGTIWKGQFVEQNDPDFVQFANIEWGIRAAFCILKTYQKKYTAVCIEDIIARWAPQKENNTAAYINGVCRLTGFGGKERLREEDWPQLVRAMAMIECGALLPMELIVSGYNLYKKLQNERK